MQGKKVPDFVWLDASSAKMMCMITFKRCFLEHISLQNEFKGEPHQSVAVYICLYTLLKKIKGTLK